MVLDEKEIEALFTRADGSFSFARWGRPIVPVVFGVDESSLSTIKGAVEAICTLAGHEMAETDPELGANFMWFFLRDWNELLDVPNMDQLIPGLANVTEKLVDANAAQYRSFRFDDQGAIQACFVFLRMTKDLEEMPADALALAQVTQSVLLWSETAFQGKSPLALAGDTTVLRPEIGALIRAAYDPVMPPAAHDASHALRLAARLGPRPS